MLELIILAQAIFIIVGVYLAVSKASYYKHKIELYEADSIKNSDLYDALKRENTFLENQINNAIGKINESNNERL